MNVAGLGLAKYLPVVFLMVKQDGGIRLNIAQVAHTLIIAGIVAGVTMWGTTQALEVRTDRMEIQLKDISMKLDAVAMKQSAMVAQAQIIHDNQDKRLDRIERKK